MVRTSAPSVPRGLIALAQKQAGLVDVAQCEQTGVTDHRRRRLLAGGAWIRVARGVFDIDHPDPAMHPLDVRRRRRVWLARLAFPRAAVLSGGALVVAGVDGVPLDFLLEVALPGSSHARSRAGVIVRQVDVARDVVRYGEIVAASVDLALAQAARCMSRGDWVACADNAVRQGIAGLGRVRQHMDRLRLPAELRELPDLVDPRSESPLESRYRVRFHDAGLAPDDLQRDIYDDAGTFLGRADIAWHLGDGRWLLVEIDGNEYHRTDDQLHRDATRQNGLLAGGRHTLLRYRQHHLRDPAVTAEVRAVLEREGRLPADSPAATNHPPAA